MCDIAIISMKHGHFEQRFCKYANLCNIACFAFMGARFLFCKKILDLQLHNKTIINASVYVFASAFGFGR